MKVFVAGGSGSIGIPLANAKAMAELGWSPKYPTMRDGLAQMLSIAA